MKKRLAFVVLIMLLTVALLAVTATAHAHGVLSSEAANGRIHPLSPTPTIVTADEPTFGTMGHTGGVSGVWE